MSPRGKLNPGQVRKLLGEVKHDDAERGKVMKSLREKGLLGTLDEHFEVSEDQRRELGEATTDGKVEGSLTVTAKTNVC